MLIQRILLVALLAILFLSAPADAAQKPEATSDESPPAARRTIVFFGSESPIFLQTHLMVDGTDFDEWFASFLFQAVDTSRDGSITQAEMQAVPPDLLGRVAGGVLMNTEGGLSVDQLRKSFSRHADELFAIEARRQAQSQAVQLLPKLDRNGDGHLDRDELASGTDTLARRDLDDDETFSASELLPFNDPLNRTAVVMTQTADLPFAQVTPGTTEAIVDRIMKRYGPVSIAAEKLKDAAAIKRIDTNSDGRLERSEITKLLAEPPNHVSVTINVPGRTFPRTRVSVSVAPAIAGSVTVEDTSAGKKRLSVEGVPIEIEARGGSRTNRMDHRQMIMVRYSSADKDKNRYLDEDEYNAFVGMVRQYGFNAGFTTVDADSDKMVLRTELKGHIERDAMLSQCRLVMRVASKAKSLFQLLDENTDNRLSRREFRTGFAKVADLDANHDGRIGDNELSSEFQLSFSLGRPITFTSQANQTPNMNSADGRVPRITELDGPRWFVRMDRNRDGDVSRREFLGTADMFKQTDTDSDGLIGLEEANVVGSSEQ